jgi:hypothetical protein
MLYAWRDRRYRGTCEDPALIHQWSANEERARYMRAFLFGRAVAFNFLKSYICASGLPILLATGRAPIQEESI